MEGGGEEGDDLGKSRRVIAEARVVCNIRRKGLGCSKVFKRQMRAHLGDQSGRSSDSNENIGSILQKGSEGSVAENGGTEARCPVCSRSFPSKNAMYGHMRCHPEREWRGINPPPSAKPASSSSVSQEIDGLSHSSVTSAVVSSDTNPSHPPLRWTKTGRRGQNRIINSYSTLGSSSNISPFHKKRIEEKHQAVSECVGLQKRQQIKMFQVGNPRDYRSKKLKIDELGALGLRGPQDASWKDFLKGALNLGPKDKKSTDDRIIPGGQLDDQIAKNTKKMSGKLANYIDVSHNKQFLKKTEPRKYKCKTCNKAFPTYQALRGNRSSHSSNKSVAMEKQCASSSHTIASEEEGLALGTSKQVVQNAHMCQTCNKTFPTGQALETRLLTGRNHPN